MRKYLTISALIVLIDQSTKIAVKGFNLFGIEHQGMQKYDSFTVLGEFFRVTFIENPGMAFGLNFGMPVVLSLFSLAAAIFLVFLLKRLESAGSTGLKLALALILGGAVGNLIDRTFYGLFYHDAALFYGHVVDFIDIDIPDINLFGFQLQRFYTFNIADAAVSVGVVLLSIFYPRPPSAAASESSGTFEADTPPIPSGSTPPEGGVGNVGTDEGAGTIGDAETGGRAA